MCNHNADTCTATHCLPWKILICKCQAREGSEGAAGCGEIKPALKGTGRGERDPHPAPMGVQEQWGEEAGAHPGCCGGMVGAWCLHMGCGVGCRHGGTPSTSAEWDAGVEAPAAPLQKDRQNLSSLTSMCSPYNKEPCCRGSPMPAHRCPPKPTQPLSQPQ